MTLINRHVKTLATVAALSLSSTMTKAEVWIEEIQKAELPVSLLSNNKTKIVLKPNGNLGGGTNVTIVGGQHVSGKYRITSDSTSPITINLSSDNDTARIRLKRFKARYGGKTYKAFPVTGLANPGMSGAILSIGFTTVIKSGANEGSNELSYILDVSEDQP